MIRNWPYLVMSLPLIAQKMLHQDPAKWGLFDQYSVEFAVILPLAAFTWIARVPDLRWRHRAGGITLLLVLAGTFHALYLPEEHRDPMHGAHDRLRFWSMGHFRPVFDRDVASRLLSKVPDGAPVSTMPPLVPHLVEREYLYQFPLIGNSEFILLVRHAYPWPMTFEEYAAFVSEYTLDKAHEISGVPKNRLEELAELYADPDTKVTSFWTMAMMLLGSITAARAAVPALLIERKAPEPLAAVGTPILSRA